MRRRAAAVIAATILMMVPVAVAHADEQITEGDFTFSCGTSSATVTDFVGPIGGSGEIPPSVECPGGSTPVTSIGREAFYGSGIKNLTIPEGVVLIDRGAFFSTTLRSLALPDSMRTLGQAAFFEGSIQSINLNAGLTTISDDAFKNAGVYTMEIPASVTFMGRAALGSTSLRSVVMLGPVPDTGGANPFEGGRDAINRAVVVAVPNAYYQDYLDAGWGSFLGVLDVIPADPDAPVETPSPDPTTEPTEEPSEDAALNARMRAEPTSVLAGNSVELNGTGFAPGVTVTVVDESGSQRGTVQADSDGEFTLSVRFSEDAAPGVHRLEARADDGESAEVTILVEEAEPSPSPEASVAADASATDSSSTNVLPWIVLAILGIGALAALAWWLVRRQRVDAVPQGTAEDPLAP